MQHREVLETNISALGASLSRLEARDDLTTEEQLKVIEIRVIHNSLVQTLEELS